MLLALLAVGLGSLHFTASGPRDCQLHAREGLLLLHSFVYEGARAEFRKAEAAAPCPIAFWGEAMTYDHPLWNEEDVQAARAVLDRIPPARVTPLESGLILAAKALFYGRGDWQVSHEAWLAALARLHQQLPNDDEAALFHALALYVCSHHGKDDARAMQAAAIAQKVFERNPDHPGAAHYLIHACDSPQHAAMALAAARKYAQIAPAAPHALHMPSHIFVQLGMWHDVESSNIAAFAASKKIGRPDWHSFRWLADARIELGKAQLVLPMLQQLHPADSLEQRWVYALILEMYFSSGVGGVPWDEALFAKLHEPKLPVEDEPGYREPEGLSHAPYGLYALQAEVETRLEHAAATGNEVAARKLALENEALAARIKHGAVKLLDDARIAQARSVRDPSALEEAIAKTWALADFQDAQPVSGPADYTPARERLGDLLLRAHRSADAARAFQRALVQRPNRLHALRGLSAAALAAGQPDVAAKARAQIAVQEQ
jgi:tetratricopeptide (TPR) repeat protein